MTATDGRIGRLIDFYFDYATWTVTHIGLLFMKGFKPFRTVLPVEKVKDVDVLAKEIVVGASVAQIRRGREVHKKESIVLTPTLRIVQGHDRPGTRSHPLRGINGFTVRGIDGPAGHVFGAIVNCGSWFVESILLKNERGPWSTTQTISTGWLSAIHWNDEVVDMELTSEGARPSRQFNLTDFGD